MLDSEAKSGIFARTLADFGPFLSRWLLLAVLCGAVGAVIILASGARSEPSFTAESALLLTAPQDGLASVNAVTPPQVDASVYRTAVLEGGVLATVLQQLGEPAGPAAEDALARRVKITLDRQLISSVIRIRVSAAAPEQAALLANLIAGQVLQWDRDRATQTLQSATQSLRVSAATTSDQLAAAATAGDAERIAALETRLEQLQTELNLAEERVADLVTVPLVRILNQAELPLKADGARSGLALLVFLVVTLLVLGSAWLVALLGNAVQYTRDLEEVSGLPLLSVFPPPGRRTTAERQDAADKARDRLFQGEIPLKPVIVLVTSPAETAEKEGLAIALAESFGRSGLQTLLLDADLRQPTSGAAFHLSEREFVSLEQFLTEADRRLEFVSVRLEGRRVFSLIPSFTPASWPAELLRNSLGQLLTNWQQRFQVIVIDSAALLPFADTGGIASLADVVVLGTKLGRTQPEALQRSITALRQLHGASPALVTSAAWSIGTRLAASRSASTRDYAISILRAPREYQAEPYSKREDTEDTEDREDRDGKGDRSMEVRAEAAAESTRPLT